MAVYVCVEAARDVRRLRVSDRLTVAHRRFSAPLVRGYGGAVGRGGRLPGAAQTAALCGGRERMGPSVREHGHPSHTGWLLEARRFGRDAVGGDAAFAYPLRRC